MASLFYYEESKDNLFLPSRLIYSDMTEYTELHIEKTRPGQEQIYGTGNS